MRKAMKNTIFGTALVAALLAAGTAANAQRPGFEGRGEYGHGGYGRGFDHPVVREGFRGGYGYGGPRVGFGVTVGVPAPVVDTYADTYIPPCPGDGYDWVAGYYNGGVWFPGAWRVRAGYVGRGYAAGRVAYDRGYDHGYDRGFNRGGGERGGERGFARGGNFGRR